MNRRASHLLQLIVLSCSITVGIGRAASVNRDGCVLRFAVLGDRTGGAQPGIYERIVQQIERLQPEFVITVGDMIEGPAPDRTETDRRWEDYKALMDVLSMPVHYTPGNNDIWDDMSLDAHRDHIGEPFYSFDHRGCHFVVLDNSRWEHAEGLPPEQIAWLCNDLRAHQDAIQTLVFYHKPFWFETTAEGRPDTLHQIFRSHGVDAVFTGHYHSYFSDTYDGIRYTNVGSSGGYCTPGPTGLAYHFMWVTAMADTLHIAPIVIDAVLPWDEVTAAELKRIDYIEQHAISFKAPVNVDSDLSVAEQTIEVTVVGPPMEGSLSDTLSWQVPTGWTVEPMAVPVQVSLGEPGSCSFQVGNRGPLYPVPVLTLAYPYGTGKTYLIEKPLAVARTVACTRATRSPVIDGSLSEAVWRDPVFRLFRSDGTPAVTDSTFFYFSYDDDRLCLGVRCIESCMESLTIRTRERDGEVYGEDCVGYFFQPVPEKPVVFQIYFNAVGTVFDQAITMEVGGSTDADRRWDGSYEVATHHGKGSWVIEIGIPVDQFGLSSEAAQQWRLNFRRKQRRIGETADWQIPIGYDPATFGFMDFR